VGTDEVTLTYADGNLIVAGLFELTITYVEDDDKRERCKALAARFSGDPDAMFYEATERAEPAER